MPYASSHNAWRNSATRRNTWCCSHQSVLLPNYHGPYSCAQIRQTGRTLFLQTGQAARESWVCKRRKAAPFCWEQPFFVTPTGFKPVTFWSVVRCSIQLSYGAVKTLSFKIVTPTGFKPVNFWSVVRCSIKLSYGAVISRLRVQRYTQFFFPANFRATFFKKN